MTNDFDYRAFLQADNKPLRQFKQAPLHTMLNCREKFPAQKKQTSMKNSPVSHRTALLLALSLMVMPGSAQERSGAYLGLDLGVFFPNDINTMGSNTDVKQTRCDGFLFKEYRNAQSGCLHGGRGQLGQPL